MLLAKYSHPTNKMNRKSSNTGSKHLINFEWKGNCSWAKTCLWGATNGHAFAAMPSALGHCVSQTIPQGGTTRAVVLAHTLLCASSPWGILIPKSFVSASVSS